MDAFTREDSPARPQRLHLSWTRELIPDDATDRPDERDDGFWPSTDPEAAGYVEPQRFLAAQQAARERMDHWQAGDWQYVGVVACVVAHIPIGGNSFRVMTLRSAGLWGVEDDAGEDYLRAIYEEEKASLKAELKALADGLAADLIEEEEL